mmetsp:Transcript_12205/g.51352  ORF Transcript_12205/g.51352 Transcript_12205/m.51352 type:complete len:238 (-) Transcript_12205:956-1669(-)
MGTISSPSASASLSSSMCCSALAISSSSATSTIPSRNKFWRWRSLRYVGAVSGCERTFIRRSELSAPFLRCGGRRGRAAPLWPRPRPPRGRPRGRLSGFAFWSADCASLIVSPSTTLLMISATQSATLMSLRGPTERAGTGPPTPTPTSGSGSGGLFLLALLVHATTSTSQIGSLKSSAESWRAIRSTRHNQRTRMRILRGALEVAREEVGVEAREVLPGLVGRRSGGMAQTAPNGE